MVRDAGAMHVAKVVRKQRLASGDMREYAAYLLRRTFRDGDKVEHQTLANLSALPPELTELVRASLKGEGFVPAASGGVRVAGPETGDRAGLLGHHPRCRSRVADASTDEVYAAMDWLLARKTRSRPRSRAAPGPGSEPGADGVLRPVLLVGDRAVLPAGQRGYSRDGKKGLPQIEYGLLADPDGRPVAVRVFAGNTADPTAFSTAVDVVRERFGLADRGMITAARIEAVKHLGGMGWLTCLRNPRSRNSPPRTARCK